MHMSPLQQRSWGAEKEVMALKLMKVRTVSDKEEKSWCVRQYFSKGFDFLQKVLGGDIRVPGDWSLQELRKRWGAETMRASYWQHFYRTYTQRKHRSRFFGCDLAPSWDSETDITIATLGTSSRKACTQLGTGPGFRPSQPEAWSTLQDASLLKVVLLRCSSRRRANKETKRRRP